MTGPTGRFARVAVAVALAALSVHLIHTVFGVGGERFGDLVDRWLVVIPSVAATAVCLAGAVAHGRERTAWLVLSGAIGSWTVGDLLFTVL
ncbi:MAG: hypothetical protein QOJ12_2414, partial [Thermoleophilales bacterium]|nr:hypothetical protein [Thermoleophilales bacterium]